MNQLDVALFNLSPEQIHAFLPYLWLCGGLALSTIGVGLRLSNNVVRGLHALALIPFIALLACSYNDGSQSIFGTSLEINAFTRAVGMAAACFGLLAGFFARETVHGPSEWSPLTLTAIIGMSLLPGARDWVAFFVFLETLAIPGYLLVALDIHRESSLEAAIKYLLMGAFASSLS